MRDKNCSVKKMAYTQARQKAQLRLREMKNRWWSNKAVELQAAADRHDTWTFFHGLNAVYSPREAGSVPVKLLNSVTLTDRTKILERWKEHFETVLNQSSSFDMNVLSEILQWPLASRLDEIHTHPFNGPLSGTTRVSRYQKGKSNLDFTEARDSEWQ